MSAAPLKDAGNAHLAAGRLNEALASYDAALAAGEGNPAVLHANRAAALLRAGRHADALDAADAALAADGAYAKAIFRRAQALEALDRLGEAHAAVRRLLELDPRNIEAAAMLRRVHGKAAARAATSGLSGASDAAAGLRAPGASDAQRAAHARKLAAIASDRDRASELLKCGAVGVMLAMLPARPSDARPAARPEPHRPAAQAVPEAQRAAQSSASGTDAASSGARFEEMDDDDEAGSESRASANAALAGVRAVVVGGGGCDAGGSPSAASAAGTAPTALESLGSVPTLTACLEGLCFLLAGATRSPLAAEGQADAPSGAELATCAQLRAAVLAAASEERAAALAQAALSAAEEAGALGQRGTAEGGGGDGGDDRGGAGRGRAAARPDLSTSPLPRLASLALLFLARLTAAAAIETAASAPARPPGSPSLDEEPPQPSARLVAALRALASLTDRARALGPSAEARALCRSCLDGWLVLAALPHALGSASLDDGARSASLRALLPFVLTDCGAALALPPVRAMRPPGSDHQAASDPDGSQRHAALAALTPLLRARGPKGQANEHAILATFAQLCRPALDAAERAAADGLCDEARAVRASVVEMLAALAELNRQAAARAALQQGLPLVSGGWHALELRRARADGAAAAAASAARAQEGERAGEPLPLAADERFCLAICELYAHALAASELLSDKDGAVVALTQLRLCAQHAAAPVRCRAIVALAKVQAVHSQLRGSIVSLRALLNGTLALLTAAQPRDPQAEGAGGRRGGGAEAGAAEGAAAAAGLDLLPRSQLCTYRWAVEGLMYLVALGEAKALLLGLTEGAGLSSFRALATFLHRAHASARARANAVAGGASSESPASLAAAAASATAVASLHYPLAWCVWRLVGGKEVSEEERRLQGEMAPEQIAQFKKLARGQGKAAGEAEAEGEDESAYDPALLGALRARLVRDDGVCLLAEVAAQAGAAPHGASTRAACAKALLALAELPEARGQLCAQGGFSACLQLANGPGADFGTPPGAPPRTDEPTAAKFDRQAAEAAAWALAKVAISTDPSLLPGAGGAASAQAGLVRPLLRLLDVAEHELPQFEAVMALTNLAAAGPEMQARLMREGTWRRLQLLLAEENPLLCRAAVECLANLATCDDALELVAVHDSTDLKIFLGMCDSDDELTQQAASGACATLASVPEVADAMLHEANRKGTLDKLVGLLLSAGSPAIQHRAVVWLSSLAQRSPALLFGAGADDAPTHALTLAAALSLCARGERGPAPALAAALLRDAERRRGGSLPVPPADVLEGLLERCRADEEARAAAAEARAAEEAEAKAAKAKAEREASEAEMKARAAEHRRRQEAEDRQSRKWAGEIDSDEDDEEELG